MESSLLDDIANQLVETLDPEVVANLVNQALDQGIDPVKIIDNGIAKGLRIAGQKYEDGEFFLMHLVAAAEAANKPMNELLIPIIREKSLERTSLGKVVIGTVAGDIHDIGKNIVAAMLVVEGFDVYDIGKDVTVKDFIDKVKEINANLVGASALLSTTLPQQREIVKALEKEGLREKVKVIIGGAPVTMEWTEEIGADGYGSDAVEAVVVAKKLMGA
jgi:corrinoid protein of di/trimethylamine methyltransferase